MGDMSVEAPKSPSRRKLLIGAAAATTLAVGGTAILLNSNKEPGTSVASPTPTRSPEPTKTAEPTRSPEPTKTAEPTPNPVELAIKNGELKLNGEKDWEKYFISITPEEAEQLLKENEKVTTNEDFKFLLPFDPRKSSNLLLKNANYEVAGIKAKIIGANNIAVGTVFYSQQTGMGRMSEDRANLYLSTRNGTDVTSIVLPREGSKIFISDSSPLKIGTPTAAIGSLASTEFSTRFSIGEFQTLLQIGRNVRQTNDGSISQLLRKDGKFAFIAQAA